MHQMKMLSIVCLISASGCQNSKTEPIRTRASSNSLLPAATVDSSASQEVPLDIHSENLRRQIAFARAEADADATPPSTQAIADYALMLAEEGDLSSAKSYVDRLSRISKDSAVAGELNSYIGELEKNPDEEETNRLHKDFRPRYMQAYQNDLKSSASPQSGKSRDDSTFFRNGALLFRWILLPSNW